MFETFIKKLKNDTFITLETTPQHSAKFKPIIEKIKELKLNEKIDGFSVTDSPLSKLKYSGLFGALQLQNSFNRVALATMSMRDKNIIALQSDLLGANEFNIRAILALTGDPIKLSDQNNPKGVFEGNSNLLLDIISNFNKGRDLKGKEFKEKPEKIYPFSVINSYSKNPQNLLKKMITKLEHKTIGIITQPIYSLESAKMLLNFLEEAKEKTENREVELILGFFPITKYRTAKFLSEKLPGVYVPDNWLRELEEAKKIGEEREFEVGYQMSLNILQELYRLHPKIHIMSANNFRLANDLIKSIRG